MAQLGRIGGHLLDANLKREGVDLKFSNTTFDSTPLLYFDVTNKRIGIKTDAPIYDLDIRTDVSTTNASATLQARLDNVLINADGSFSTIVGPLNIMPQTAGSAMYFEQMRSDDLYFNDNKIGGLNSSQSVELQASGSGVIDVVTNTNIYGDLGVTGNINLDGDLSAAENVIVGDSPLDVVVISPDLTQDIIPGDDNKHELGQQANDSSPRRWSELWTPDLTNVVTNRPYTAKVSDQMYIDGRNNELFGMQSDDDIFLSPDTEINYIEDTRWKRYTASATQATIVNDELTISGTITGQFFIGMEIQGTGVGAGTIITEYVTGSDSVGVYKVNISHDGLTPTLGIGTPPNPNPITTPIAITGHLNVIENLTDYNGAVRIDPETPLTFGNTGIGYTRFMGTNAMVIPAGDDSQRAAYPEIGDTRWNTNLARLECFAGEVEGVNISGSIAGLADQIQSGLSGTTNGYGSGAEFTLQIISGVLTATVTNPGIGYNKDDTILILGTEFVGGSSPTNDITLTVGLQTDDGYQISTGGGAEVNEPLMEDLGNVYSLILG